MTEKTNPIPAPVEPVVGQLVPCPFCGGKPRMRYGMGEIWIQCDGCEIGTKLYSGFKHNEAFAAWNRRIDVLPNPAGQSAGEARSTAPALLGACEKSTKETP